MPTVIRTAIAPVNTRRLDPWAVVLLLFYAVCLMAMLATPLLSSSEVMTVTAP